MGQFLKIAAALLLMVSLAGFCTGGGFDNLQSVLQSGPIGNSNDYWLEKQSAFEPGRYDRVAVIFGMDDQQACNAITRALLASYQETWRCEPAN